MLRCPEITRDYPDALGRETAGEIAADHALAATLSADCSLCGEPMMVRAQHVQATRTRPCILLGFQGHCRACKMSGETITARMADPAPISPDAIDTAAEWHSGQASALYSLSSTGRIHGTEHRDDLAREIYHALSAASRSDSSATEDEIGALDWLAYVVNRWPAEAV